MAFMLFVSGVIAVCTIYIKYLHDLIVQAENSYLTLFMNMIPVLWILYCLHQIGLFSLSWYRIKTAAIGFKRLWLLPAKQKQACIKAYEFLQGMQAGNKTSTEEETQAVVDYYNVLNEVLIDRRY
eukprot:UN01993